MIIKTRCRACGNIFGTTRDDAKWCSNACKQRQYRGRKNYTADKIEVRDYAQYGWEEATALAEKYKKDPEHIQRGLEACRIALVGTDYFIQRYLEGDKSVPFNKDVDLAMREQLNPHSLHQQASRR